MIEALIHKLNNYTDFSPQEISILRSAHKETRHFSKGSPIIIEGEQPSYVHMIIDGWGCRYKMLADGREQILGYLIAGDMCDLHVTLLSRMDHSIRALTPVSVAFIPENSIKQIIDEQPRLASALFWSLTVDEAILRNWLLNLGLRDAESRIAHFFCEMLLRFRANGLVTETDFSFPMPLTQTQLGETISLTPIHTNRILQRLRQKGLITLKNRELIILDWEGLKEVGGFEERYLHFKEKQIKRA